MVLMPIVVEHQKDDEIKPSKPKKKKRKLVRRKEVMVLLKEAKYRKPVWFDVWYNDSRCSRKRNIVYKQMK